jgi:hypothetical protein
MIDTQELIARIEAATGPDRELDAAIYAAMNPEMRPIPNLKGRFFNPAKTTAFVAKDYHLGKGVTDVAPSFSASIDAALTLVPGKWKVRQMNFSAPCADDRKWWLNLHGGKEGEDTFTGLGATPALAICIAALKARRQTDD